MLKSDFCDHYIVALQLFVIGSLVLGIVGPTLNCPFNAEMDNICHIFKKITDGHAMVNTTEP